MSRVPQAPPPSSAFAASAASARIFAGTSGWAYPTWKPDFYPAGTPAKRFLEFYACAERRLAGLANLAYGYFEAGDFSGAAEAAFVAAARIDDLAEPEPQPEDDLPPLPRLPPVRRYRLAPSANAAQA